MDFRQYDSGIGRFYGLDLLAEATPWATPNHFALNNPVIASDPTGLLAASPWNDLIAFMNEFATGGGGGGPNASMTYTSNMNSNGGNSWGFNVSYNNGTGTNFDVGSISGSSFSINSFKPGNGFSWQNTYTQTGSSINNGQWRGFNATNRLDTQVITATKSRKWVADAANAFGVGSMYFGTYLDMLSDYTQTNAGEVFKYGSREFTAAQLTTQNAAYMTRVSKIAGTASKYLGGAGLVVSGLSIGYKKVNNIPITTAEAVSAGIGATFLVAGSIASAAAAGTALAAASPFIAAGAIIYGLGEIISYSTTGQTLEEHIFKP